MEAMNVNNKSFGIIKLLGKGKGGYSYLVAEDGVVENGGEGCKGAAVALADFFKV